MRINKKNIKKKFRYFPKNVVYFVFFINEMECEKGEHDFSNKVIIFNAPRVLAF